MWAFVAGVVKISILWLKYTNDVVGMPIMSALLASLAVASSEEDDFRYDTYDVHIALYNDDGCFSQADQLLLSTTNCYANLYTETTAAFMLTVVSFQDEEDSLTGKTLPVTINVKEYLNDCHTLSGDQPVTSVFANQCQPFLGQFSGVYTLRHRSYPTPCSGSDCSTIRMVYNRFYISDGCSESVYLSRTFPLGEPGVTSCIRYANGTMEFALAGNSTIVETDYPYSRNCQPATITNETHTLQIPEQVWTISVGKCYPLQGRSFDWHVDQEYAISEEDSDSGAHSLGMHAALVSLIIAWRA